MDEQSRLQMLSPILRQYSIEPYFVENFGKIQKIYSNIGIFALKKIPPGKGIEFIRQIQYLYQKGYHRIVPVYPALDGRYAVLHQNELYYLMPWLPNEEKETHVERQQQLFRELARLHTLSAREVKINKEERTEHYENTLLQLEKENEFLDGYIEECEKKWYMSPFELMFCLYNHDISEAVRFSKKKLEEWYEKTKDQEKARIVSVHGKMSPEHFLFDDRGYGYFINFESTRQASPIHDLLPYLSRTLRSLPKRADECVECIMTYFKYFPLKEDEMLLFLSYLAHPGPILRATENYHKGQNGKSEQKLVQQLQRQYWLLKNTEYVAMKLDEAERQKQQAKQAQKEAQS